MSEFTFSIVTTPNWKAAASFPVQVSSWLRGFTKWKPYCSKPERNIIYFCSSIVVLPKIVRNLTKKSGQWFLEEAFYPGICLWGKHSPASESWAALRGAGIALVPVYHSKDISFWKVSKRLVKARFTFFFFNQLNYPKKEHQDLSQGDSFLDRAFCSMMRDRIRAVWIIKTRFPKQF